MNTLDEQVPADLKHREDDTRAAPNNWINWDILDDNTRLKIRANIRNGCTDALYDRKYYHTSGSRLALPFLFEPCFVTTPADRTGR